jgi:hypothetical protein
MLRCSSEVVRALKYSRENRSGGKVWPDEVHLPPGYFLDRSDPDLLVLRSPRGAVVGRFSARGYVAESVERVAWEDFHKQPNRPV